MSSIVGAFDQERKHWVTSLRGMDSYRFYFDFHVPFLFNRLIGSLIHGIRALHPGGGCLLIKIRYLVLRCRVVPAPMSAVFLA